MNRTRTLAAVLLAPLLVPTALHAQGATVEGKVISSLNGNPVRRATVVLRATINPQSGQAATRTNYMTETDANGNFQITGVAAGPYTCAPSHQGYAAQPPDQLGPSYYPLINVKDGDHVTDVVLRLTPMGVISGRVMDPEGDPLSRAQVEVLQYGYARGARTLASTRSVQSDDRGEFRVFGLYPGQYYVRVSKPAEQRFNPGQVRGPQPPLAFSSVYYPNAADPAQAAPIDLPAGGELRGIDVRLSRSGVYSIRGKLGGWSPQSGSSVNLNIQKQPRDASFIPRGGWQISDDGYTFPNVPPGSYVITATLNYPSTPGKQPLRARQLVQVVNQDVSGADLNFAPAMEVSGTVRVAGTTAVPLSSVHVVLMAVEEGVATDRTNPQGGVTVKSDGTFTVPNLLPDLYQIRIAPVNLAYVQSMKLRDQELPDQRLDLRRGAVGPIAIVVAGDLGKIEGTVKDDQGRPVAQSNVTLIPDDTKTDWLDRYTNNVTDAQGKFYFNKVVPGNYQLFAWQDNPRGAPTSREYRKPFEGYALSLKLEPGGHPIVELKWIPNQQQTQAAQ
jgi:hypothetical protein